MALAAINVAVEVRAAKLTTMAAATAVVEAVVPVAQLRGKDGGSSRGRDDSDNSGGCRGSEGDEDRGRCRTDMFYGTGRSASVAEPIWQAEWWCWQLHSYFYNGDSE